MNAIVARQLLWHNEEDFETESLLYKLWTSRHKIYITTILTHLVLELRKNKNLRYWFKARRWHWKQG